MIKNNVYIVMKTSYEYLFYSKHGKGRIKLWGGMKDKLFSIILTAVRWTFEI